MHLAVLELSLFIGPWLSVKNKNYDKIKPNLTFYDLLAFWENDIE